MKVSIIIPVYNVAPYIQRCLDSVVAQTFQDIECILVDDCGTDNSVEVAQQYIDNYRGQIQFKLIHHDKNQGLSGARNTGIRMATMMMIPPIVGTPFFSTPNGSMLTSRAVSDMLRRFIHLMKYSPNHADIISERISANSERKEIYDQMCAPGISYCSKNLKI